MLISIISGLLLSTFLNLESDLPGHRGRYCIAHLSVLVQDCSKELVRVGKPLRAGTFTNAHYYMLLGMNDTTLCVCVCVCVWCVVCVCEWVCVCVCVCGQIRVRECIMGMCEWVCLAAQTIRSHLFPPIGSGLETVVEKNPSHSRRPYRPDQWLCLLPVWGRHQGMRVPNCLSAGSHDPLAVALEHTPLRFRDVPFLSSRWVYLLHGGIQNTGLLQ